MRVRGGLSRGVPSAPLLELPNKESVNVGRIARQYSLLGALGRRWSIVRRYLSVLGADSCLSSSFDDPWLDRRPLAASEKPLGLYFFLEVFRLRTRSAPAPEGVVLLGLPTPLDLCAVRSLSPFVVLLFELGRHGISRKRENTECH